MLLFWNIWFFTIQKNICLTTPKCCLTGDRCRLPTAAECNTVPQGYKDQNDLCIFACFMVRPWYVLLKFARTTFFLEKGLSTPQRPPMVSLHSGTQWEAILSSCTQTFFDWSWKKGLQIYLLSNIYNTLLYNNWVS